MSTEKTKDQPHLQENITSESVTKLLRKRGRKEVVVMIVLTALLAIFIIVVQGAAISREQRDMNLIRLEDAKAAAISTSDQKKVSREQFDAQLTARLKMMGYMYDHTPNVEARWRELATNGEFTDINTVMLVEANGTDQSVIHSEEGVPLSALTLVQNLLATPSGTVSEPMSITMDSGTVLRFFAEKLECGKILVIGKSTADLEEEISRTIGMASVLSSLNNGSSGFVAAVNISSDEILYDNDEAQVGQSAAGRGFTADVLKDGYSGYVLRDREAYTANTAVYEDIAPISMTPINSLSANRIVNVMITLVLFAAICGLLISLGLILRNEVFNTFEMPQLLKIGRKNKDGKAEGHYLNMTILRKLVPVAAVGLVVIVAVSLLMQSVYMISDVSSESASILTEVQRILDKNTETADYVKNVEESQYISKAHVVSRMLEDNPGWIFNNDRFSKNVHEIRPEKSESGTYTGYDAYGKPEYSSAVDSDLVWLCNLNSLQQIYVFDENGCTIATSADFWNFRLSEDSSMQSYPFWEVLRGTKTDYVQDAGVDEIGNYSQYIGTTFYYYTYQDGSGTTCYTTADEFVKQGKEGYTGPVIKSHLGMVQINVNPKEYARVMNATTLSYVLSNYHVSYNGFLTAYDKSDDPVLVYSPRTASIGRTASSLGADTSMFTGSGDIRNVIQTINGVSYYQGVGEISGYYICTAVPIDQVFKVRDTVTTWTLFLTLISFAALVLYVSLVDSWEAEMYAQAIHQKEAYSANEDAPYVLPRKMSARQRQRENLLARIESSNITWSEKTPTQKLATLLRLYTTVLALILFINVILVRTNILNVPLDTFVMSSNWPRNVNIVTVSRSLATLIIAVIGSNVLAQVVTMVSRPLGSRATTVGRLISSVVKYGVVLFAIFYGLYIIGLNASNLLASAGIISIVIGLGAQSVIKDVLAGIFIVFEGELHVGDIVTIGGFNGTVIDVGLRTTKIKDDNGDIKIFDNSDISGVLNMSEELSTAIVSVQISYSEDLEKAEDLIRKELKHLKQKDHQIVEEPEYAGVTDLGSGGPELTIRATCMEKNKYDVTNYIRRTIYLMLIQNGIKLK